MSLRSGLAMLGLAVLMTGCTTQNWYEGMRESQRQQCRQQYPSALDQQNCIDKVNSKSYEQYRAERADATTSAKP